MLSASSKDISGLPVTFTRAPLAPVTSTSRSGLFNASLAAFSALSSVSDSPIPIIATPFPSKTVATSAKSRLISPGFVINSVTPFMESIKS